MRALFPALILLFSANLTLPVSSEQLTIFIEREEKQRGFTSMSECKSHPSTIVECERVVSAGRCDGRAVYASDLTAQTMLRAYKADRHISITSRSGFSNEVRIYCSFN